MLFESPIHATVVPRMAPRCSKYVKMSASIWHGWYSLVSPLMTGTRELRGEALDDRLPERADHDDVDHARDDARRVLDRLAAAELRVAAC